jgi:hypothetical protein
MPRNNENEDEEEMERLRVKRAITGSVAKMHPTVYREIKKEAEELGLETDEVILEMFEIWRLSKTIEDVDPKSFLAGYSFGMFELRRAISTLNSLGKLWISDFMNAQASLLEQLNKQREAIYNQIKSEVEKELEQRGVTDLKKVWSDFKEIVREISGLLLFPIQQTQQSSSLSSTEEKPKIKVEIEE